MNGNCSIILINILKMNFNIRHNEVKDVMIIYGIIDKQTIMWIDGYVNGKIRGIDMNGKMIYQFYYNKRWRTIRRASDMWRVDGYDLVVKVKT